MTMVNPQCGRPLAGSRRPEAANQGSYLTADVSVQTRGSPPLSPPAAATYIAEKLASDTVTSMVKRACCQLPRDARGVGWEKKRDPQQKNDGCRVMANQVGTLGRKRSLALGDFRGPPSRCCMLSESHDPHPSLPTRQQPAATSFLFCGWEKATMAYRWETPSCVRLRFYFHCHHGLSGPNHRCIDNYQTAVTLRPAPTGPTSQQPCPERPMTADLKCFF